MKKIKTADLQGNTLDWVVAKCAGIPVIILDKPRCVYHAQFGAGRYQPSEKWEHAGPIMDKAVIDTHAPRPHWPKWVAYVPTWPTGAGMVENWRISGETRLIAAMRCYVASKLGAEVDIPDTLT